MTKPIYGKFAFCIGTSPRGQYAGIALQFENCVVEGNTLQELISNAKIAIANEIAALKIKQTANGKETISTGEYEFKTTNKQMGGSCKSNIMIKQPFFQISWLKNQ